MIPVSWTEHAVAEFGERPQAVINRQLVENSDFGLAIFVNRLGTATGNHPSGTVEEIEELAAAGRPVAVLRRIDQAAQGLGPAEELARLESHLQTFRERSLLLEYRDTAQLIQHVNQLIARSVSAAAARPATGTLPRADVWAEVRNEASSESDSRGAIRSRIRHFLIIKNLGFGPGRNVQGTIRRSMDEGEAPFAFNLDSIGPIETLPPSTEMNFGFGRVLGSAQQAVCDLTWLNDDGSAGSSSSTLHS